MVGPVKHVRASMKKRTLYQIHCVEYLGIDLQHLYPSYEEAKQVAERACGVAIGLTYMEASDRGLIAIMKVSNAEDI